MKLRPRILSLILGLLLLSFLALSVPLYWYTRGALEDELDKRLLSVAGIAAANIDRSLLNALLTEPALGAVRKRIEGELARFSGDDIEGIAVYTASGDELAISRQTETHSLQLAFLLQRLAERSEGNNSAVSEIYELSDGTYLKAAAATLSTDGSKRAVVVVWAGAGFMTVIEQIVGSLFWTFLVSLVLAVTLAIVFSRSLLRPVDQLSGYARSIEKNLYSDTVDLGRRDEFGDLNRSLAEMHREIQQHEQSTKQLLSGIAHEIKNPLGGMEIYTGLLNEELETGSDGEAAEEKRSYLEKITRELTHLKQIVTEYLDYARPLKSDLKQVSLELVMDDAFRLLLPEFKEKDVHTSLSGAGAVMGDESKLRRVFVNLLKNSLAAVTSEGAIDVTIEKENDSVTVRVSDNGRGIPLEDREKIFEPYFTTQDKGYGLGLTITKNIVDEMNGTIVVSSSDGKGTTFTVELPAR